MKQQKQTAADMLANMDRYLAALPKPEPVSGQQELDEETRKALKGLGYVD